MNNSEYRKFLIREILERKNNLFSEEELKKKSIRILELLFDVTE